MFGVEPICRVLTEHGMPIASSTQDLVNRKFDPAAPNTLWIVDFERHEALSNRVGVGDLHRRAVAAAG